MRFSYFIAASLLTFVLGLNSAFGTRTVYNKAAITAERDTTVATGSGPEMVVLAGKITNPAGSLPGAVVILTGTKQMAVTNADGEFEFVVPANAGALDALVTYAGYADEKMTLNAAATESTVSLTNARVIVVSRKQQLKHYLKTAHKQVKRELRQVRK
ncbi:hypothetical protein GCM10028822_42480 [Hymenobacter terrigena]